MLPAVLIFIIVYIAIASEQFPRHWTSLLGGGVLIVAGVLTPTEALSYVNWETLGLLSGMFILVAILHEAGFFEWLAMVAIKRVNYRPAALFIILITLSAFFAMWMDSITVMLFMAALTIQLCRLLKLDPVPLVIAEVCAANTGGAATLVGDPPNVILGTTLGFNFMDFLTHTGPISGVIAILMIIIFYFMNRKSLKEAHAGLDAKTIAEIEEMHKESTHAHLTRVGLFGFLLAVGLLIFHHPLSHLTGLPINAAVSALVPAGIAVIALRDDQRKVVMKRFDGESILFFAGLFILIGGLEKVHLFELLATELAKAASESHLGLVLALHWGPGLASGVLDNVPLALAMSYVLADLAKMPAMPALSWMVWSLALGVDIGGNITPIGASANVVAYSFTERTHGKIGWKRWIAIAAPATILGMVVASVFLAFKGSIGWY